MKFLKVGVVIGCVSLCSYAFADAASEKEAEKLLNVINMKTALEDSMSQMLNIQLQQNPSLGPYRKVMEEFLAKYMSYDSLKDDMIRMYGDAFTTEELKEITAFYKTEIGQKTIEKMPALMAQGGQIGAQRVQQHIGELQNMIQAESERLQSQQNTQ